jgi:hypothetical protein
MVAYQRLRKSLGPVVARYQFSHAESSFVLLLLHAVAASILIRLLISVIHLYSAPGNDRLYPYA